MSVPVSEIISRNIRSNKKMLAVLLDPDKVSVQGCQKMARLAVECKVDFIFVGGSLLTEGSLKNTIVAIKGNCDIPVVIFPGSNVHVSDAADAILFLSLVSGRNPDLLIGQHVAAAPFLKKSGLEVLSTGYLLIDGGAPTTVSYISNTNPIPRDKPEIAAATAMASELLGHKLIYLDAGSGAELPVSKETIRSVRKSVDVPMVVGGGIRSQREAQEAWEAGADVIVVGNMLEKDPSFLIELSELKEFI